MQDMHAVVLANRPAGGLEPVASDCSTPMLPVVGKPLLVYTIEDLVSAAISNITVIYDPKEEQGTLTGLGDGIRWGISLRFLPVSNKEPVNKIIGHISLEGIDKAICLRGDVLRAPTVSQLVLSHQKQPAINAAIANDNRANIIIFDPRNPEGSGLEQLNWKAGKGSGKQQKDQVIEIGYHSGLDNLKDFHQANLDILGGRVQGLTPSGYSPALGVTTAPKAQVHPRIVRQGEVFVGARSHVDPSAMAYGTNIVGDDVIVDRGVTLRDAVILPNTYVGEFVEVKSAILKHQKLIRVDTGAIIDISDDFLLGQNRQDWRGKRAGMATRVSGVLLLILSLPLWPIALLVSLIRNPRQPWRLRHLTGYAADQSRDESRFFTTLLFRTGIPVLANLPLLVHVAMGDLLIVGISPLSRNDLETRRHDWQHIHDRRMSGLFGPTQLLLGRYARLDERLISDAVFSRNIGLKARLSVLALALRTVFTSRAWRYNMKN